MAQPRCAVRGPAGPHSLGYLPSAGSSPALPIWEGPSSSPALMCTWRLSHATGTVVSVPYLGLWVG